MGASSFSIGVVAKQAGCTVPTIRYYEDIGLLTRAHRTDSGQRSYTSSALRRLTFIRRCRDFGFSIEQVRELLRLVDQPDRPCLEVRDVAATHLAEVQRKLSELRQLEANLRAFVCSCETACAGGAAMDCTILEDLSSASAPDLVSSEGGCCKAA